MLRAVTSSWTLCSGWSRFSRARRKISWAESSTKRVTLGIEISAQNPCGWGKAFFFGIERAIYIRSPAQAAPRVEGFDLGLGTDLAADVEVFVIDEIGQEG